MHASRIFRATAPLIVLCMERMDHDFVLTENARPGVWEVCTWSGATYQIRIDPDRALEVTRVPENGNLQHDGEPLPGVTSVAFEVGHSGVVQWWREPLERDNPGADGAYVSTFRKTSVVTSITYVNGGNEK